MNGPEERQADQDIASPFSAARTKPAEFALRKRKHKGWLVGSLIGGALLICVIAVVAVTYLNDPYRKLEDFPEERYFDGFQSLAGLRFRADLRVEADLGWKEGVGRLMVFTPNGENRQLAVFIPPSLSNVFFNKGQRYLVELEVKEGGMIYADSCRKN